MGVRVKETDDERNQEAKEVQVEEAKEERNKERKEEEEEEEEEIAVASCQRSIASI